MTAPLTAHINGSANSFQIGCVQAWIVFLVRRQTSEMIENEKKDNKEHALCPATLLLTLIVQCFSFNLSLLHSCLYTVLQ